MTSDEPVNGVQANLSYPANLLDFVSIGSSSAFSVVAQNSGGGGSVQIGRGALPAVSGTQTVATVRFKPKTGSGTAAVNFTGGTQVVSANSNQNILTSSRGASYTLRPPAAPTPAAPAAPADTIPPTINSVKVIDVKTNSVTIAWVTSEPSTSEVFYGLNNGYGIVATDNNLVTDHKVVLNSPLLVPGTKYHFMVKSVDPGGKIWSKLGPERALGCVVWQAAEIEAPGVIAHHYGDRMPVGEPSGEKTDRAALLSRLLTSAGIKSPVRDTLRNEIWLKLWGNLSFNPVSILTQGTLSGLAGDHGTRSVIRAMMEETKAVAESFGVRFAVGIDERMDMASKVGAHRTSMLQDVDAGRPTELDALLGVVIELASIARIAVPVLNIIYNLAKFRTHPV